MVSHGPTRGERRALTGATYRCIAVVCLLTATVACGRSELGGDESFENGGAGGRTGGASGRGAGTNGSSGVAGVANNSSASGGSGASGQAGNSGASGGPGSSGASGRASIGGASGSAGSVENCTNGLDDDRDGSVDCADDDCVVGFTCAPPTPGSGWVGPLSIWSGSGLPPACTNESGFPTEVTNAGTGTSVAPSSCYSCECGAPQGVTCQAGGVTIFSGQACSGQN